MNVRRRATRMGYSLIEMVLLMGGITVILVLCAGLLHTLLRLDRSGRDAMTDTATTARLARQFRQDVRASRDAKAAEDAGSLELTCPDGPTVTYKRDGGLLRREEREGGEVRRREAYAAARVGPVTFAVDGPLVRLTLSRRSGNPHAPARPALGVEATLGKDLTTVRAGGSQK